jgi:hypothetical protein
MALMAQLPKTILGKCAQGRITRLILMNANVSIARAAQPDKTERPLLINYLAVDQFGCVAAIGTEDLIHDRTFLRLGFTITLTFTPTFAITLSLAPDSVHRGGTLRFTKTVPPNGKISDSMIVASS